MNNNPKSTAGARPRLSAFEVERLKLFYPECTPGQAVSALIKEKSQGLIGPGSANLNDLSRRVDRLSHVGAFMAAASHDLAAAYRLKLADDIDRTSDMINQLPPPDQASNPPSER